MPWYSVATIRQTRVSLFDKKVDFSINMVEDLFFPLECITFNKTDCGICCLGPDGSYYRLYRQQNTVGFHEHVLCPMDSRSSPLFSQVVCVQRLTAIRLSHTDHLWSATNLITCIFLSKSYLLNCLQTTCETCVQWTTNGTKLVHYRCYLLK